MEKVFRDIVRFFTFLVSLVKEAFNNAWAHNIGRMAASIAYFGAFSLAPIIVIMITVASLVFGKRATEGLIADALTGTFGEETARFIQSMIAAIYGSTGLTLATVLAVLVLIWAATRIVGSVRGALNDIWGVQGHGGGGWLGFIVGKLIDVAMVIGIGFMFLLTMLANTAVTAMTTYFSQHLPLPGWLLQILSVLFSLAITIFFLAVMFRVLPNVKVRIVYILVGASITGILFTIGNYVIGMYLGRTSPGSAFGAAGSLAVLMIWFYYVSYIIIFGAEVTQAYARRASLRKLRLAATEAANQPAEEATETAALLKTAVEGETAAPVEAPADVDVAAETEAPGGTPGISVEGGERGRPPAAPSIPNGPKRP